MTKVKKIDDATTLTLQAKEGVECPNCYTVVQGKFCSNCGTKLE